MSYLFRSLGAVVGVSIGSTLVQGTLRSFLHRNLSGEDAEEVQCAFLRSRTSFVLNHVQIIQRVRESLSYVDKLDAHTQVIVRSGYADAIRAALSFSLCMAACAFVVSIFIKEKALPTNR